MKIKGSKNLLNNFSAISFTCNISVLACNFHKGEKIENTLPFQRLVIDCTFLQHMPPHSQLAEIGCT